MPRNTVTCAFMGLVSWELGRKGRPSSHGNERKILPKNIYK